VIVAGATPDSQTSQSGDAYFVKHTPEGNQGGVTVARNVSMSRSL